MRLFEDDAEFFSDAKPTSSLPVLDVKNSNDTRTQSTIDERNGGESLKRSEATEKGLSSITEESPALASVSSGPSFLTKLLILLIPMLAFAGFYTYSQVKGAVFFNKTLDTSTSLESGLVGHWTFDGEDMTLTTALDSSGNGNTGTLTGLATSTRVAGKIGQAIYFPDSLARYINAGSAAVLDNITQLTIAAWIYERSSGGGGTIIDKGGGAAGGWNLWIFDGTLRFDRDFSGTDGIWETDTPISTDTWHYVVVTYDKSSTGNAPVIYVDGRAIAASVSFAPVGTASSDAARNLQIGYTTNADLPFEGTLDDVRVYNRILSADEVTNLYNRSGAGIKINTTATTTGATGLVGHWTFDGPDLTTATATDKSGRGNNGVLTNGPSPVIGKTGQALSFDGTNDFVRVPPDTSTTDLPRMTVSAWIKKSTSGNIGSIVGKISSFYGWDLYYCSSVCGGSLQTLEFSQTFDGAGATWRTPANAVPLNEWVHVVVTYDRTSSSNNPIFYINGILKTTTARGGAASGSATSDDGIAIAVGKTDNGTFNGLIDDARVYNRILTADEVEKLYQKGLGVTVTPAPLDTFTCGEDTVTDADANVYDTLEIGTQCWMQQNMRVGTRINVATSQTNNSTVEKYCYSDTASNCTSNHPNQPDGGLYMWDEAMLYVTTEGAQGICPSGWHIPTDGEWYTLENYIDSTINDPGATGYRGTDGGTKLKFGGSSGFEANLAGYMTTPNISASRDTLGFFISSTASDASNEYSRLFSSAESRISRSAVPKGWAFLVRCVMD